MIPTANGLVGKVFGGYRLERLIGSGGAAAVFFAQQVDEPHAQVAVKVLLPQTLATMSAEQLADFRTRFTREARTLGDQLQHPHVLPVLGTGEDQETGLAFMIMPYMAGGTLAGRVMRGQLALPEVTNYVNQVASALDYAHSRNIVHRDVKPANVLLDERSQAYLSDFGIAKLFDLSNTTLTDSGRIMGTPEYMAPEQARGDTVSKATDIYALGMVAYHLTTGRLPFHATTWPVLMVQVLTQIPAWPRTFRPELPEPAEAVILRALAKDPAMRFASAGELASALEMGMRGQWAPGVTPGATASFTTPPTITPPPRQPVPVAAPPLQLQTPYAGAASAPLTGPGGGAPYIAPQPAAPQPVMPQPFVPSPGAPTGPYTPTPGAYPGYAPPSTPLYPPQAPGYVPLPPQGYIPQPSVPLQSQPLYPPGPYGMPPAVVVPVTDPKSGLAITGMVLGIISAVAWLLPICGLPVGVAGLIFSIIGMQSTTRHGMAVTGLVLSIIGLALTLVNAALGAAM